jgi:hypothetical protein
MQMKRDDVFPSKYYRGGDFEQPKVLVIESIRLESLKQPNGETTTKPVAYFKGAKKSLVLNRTNWDVIADIVGRDDTDTWPGTRVELYSVTQEVRRNAGLRSHPLARDRTATREQAAGHESKTAEAARCRRPRRRRNPVYQVRIFQC